MKKIFSLVLLVVTFIACGGIDPENSVKYELEFNVYLPDNTVDKKTMIIEGDQYTTCNVNTAANRGKIYEYEIIDNHLHTIYEGPFPIYITKFERIN
jgi:hypothetical protein